MRRVLVFGALLCACREKTAPPAPPDEQQALAAPERVREQEPNDFQRAQQIPARAVVAGTLQAPRDDDWYRPYSLGQGVTADELTGGGSPWLCPCTISSTARPVNDATGEFWHTFSDFHIPGRVALDFTRTYSSLRTATLGPTGYGWTDNYNESLSLDGSGNATVHAGNGSAVVFTFTAPNDRAVDATDLRPGSPVRGTLLTADDEDWYRLSVPEGSGDVLRIEVTPVVGVRPELQVRALGDGTLLATFSGTDGLFVRNLSVHLGEAADAGVPDGGPVPAGYYLVLKGRSRHGAPLAPYTLTATGANPVSITFPR